LAKISRTSLRRFWPENWHILEALPVALPWCGHLSTGLPCQTVKSAPVAQGQDSLSRSLGLDGCEALPGFALLPVVMVVFLPTRGLYKAISSH